MKTRTSAQSMPVSFYLGKKDVSVRRVAALTALAGQLGYPNAAQLLQAIADGAVIEYETVNEDVSTVANGRTVGQRTERVVYVRLRLPVD